MIKANIKLYEKLNKWSNFLTGIVLLISLSVMLEWGFGYSYFKRPLPNSVATNPLTAVVFIIIGTSFFLLTSKKDSLFKYNSGKILLTAAFVISFLKFVSLFPVFDFHIDQVLFSDQLKKEIGYVISNKMAHITAINFLLVSAALLLLTHPRTNNRTWPMSLVLTVGLVALFFLLGYIYRVREFHQVLSYFPMSLTTAFCFLFISVAILFKYPQKGFMNRFTNSLSGNTAGKILVPIAIILPLTFGYILLLTTWYNILSVEFGASLLVMAAVITFLTFTWYTAGLLNKNDLLQELAENNLRSLNETLELRVAERTKELENVNKDLADYKIAIDASNIVAVTNERGIIQYVNDNFCKISKYTKEEIIGQDHRIISSGYHSKEFIRNLWNTIASGKIWKGELRNKAKDGTIYWVDTTIYPFINVNGKPYKYLAIRSDITQRVLSHEKLKISEENYRSLFENTIVSMFTTDMHTLKPTMVNDIGAQLFGYKSRQDFLDHFNPEAHFVNFNDRKNNIEIVKEKGELGSKVQEMKKLDGSHFWAKIFIKLNSSKDIAQTVIIDITKEVRSQEILTEKVKELEKANKELEAFNFISSHDLQEPLRKIRNFGSVLIENEKNNLTEEGKYYLTRMIQTSNQMQLLIEDLLSYSRAGKGELKFEKTELNKIIAEVISEFNDIISEKRAVIKTEGTCSTNVIRFQFRQLLFNLIGNALKFTDPQRTPQIIISCKMVSGNLVGLIPEKQYCLITVADNGIGFDPQYKDRIFEIFERLYGQDKYPGTGIGLAICKKIVENHQGIIIANSEQNKGSRFDVYLPVD